jgi:pyrimidine deaminase RibD-like protein
MYWERKTLNKWYKIALKESAKSKRAKYKMAAAIIKSGRVLSVATNGPRTGRHAEVRAISKDVNFAGAIMYIARHGGEEMSRPCRACFMLIKSAGIKKIVFKEEGVIVTKVVSRESIENYRDYCLS